MSDTTYLDPLELPFTREEIFEAVRLWVRDVEATELTDQFAETAQIDIQNRAARCGRLLMVGVDDRGYSTDFQWLTPGDPPGPESGPIANITISFPPLPESTPENISAAEHVCGGACSQRTMWCAGRRCLAE